MNNKDNKNTHKSKNKQSLTDVGFKIDRDPEHCSLMR